jgi:uncharacterized protein (DUF2252 family)
MTTARIAIMPGSTPLAAPDPSPRPGWVAEQIQRHNHRFAATNPSELEDKMAAMARDIYSYYRATAHLFYLDMLGLPASHYSTPKTGHAWLSGDAHLGNFAAMRDSSGTEVFAVSDFDEGYLGQYTWDLRRLAASLLLATQKTPLASAALAAIDAMTGAYLERMAAYDSDGDKLRFQLTTENTSGAVRDTIRKGAKGSRARLLDRYAEADSHDIKPVSAATYSALAAAMPAYIGSLAEAKRHPASYYTVKNIRRRFGAGMGSLGKLRYYVLVQGPSAASEDGAILEFKQAIESSVALASSGALPPQAYGKHEGQRIARTQKAQLLHPDRLVGYTSVGGMAFHVHEKSPFDEDFKLAAIKDTEELIEAARYLGMALASAHALADREDDTAIVRYGIAKEVTEAVTDRTGFQAELAAFARGYTAQVNMDWEAFNAALAAGKPMY